MNELAKDVLSSVSLFVRVIASGWAALGLLLVLLDEKRQLAIFTLLQSSQGAWLVLTAAGLCGFCAYALYMGLLENLLLLPVLFWIRFASKSQIPADLVAVKKLLLGHTLHTLYRERKARYCATDLRVRELQSRMDNYYAWLVFLYCFAVLALVCSAVLWYYGVSPHAHCYASGAALLLWFVAFRTDVFITRVELWMVTHHRQW